MSKSGLFAHFGSKEDLQLLTLKQVQTLFLEQVFSPALKHPRGLPRLRVLFSNWLAWVERNDDLPGGCLMLAASAEYDDRPGAVRDLLVAGQRELRGAIAKAIRLAIDEGHLKSQTDPWQLTFELFGIILATHHDRRLLGDARALDRAADALERLIEAHRAAAPSA
jgi:AcrR family transcriptional regulator